MVWAVRVDGVTRFVGATRCARQLTEAMEHMGKKPLFRHATWMLALLSLVLFTVSLTLTALRLEGSRLSGWYVLCAGWWGPLAGNVAWLANPFYMYALARMAYQRFTPALVTALVAAVLSLDTWRARAWWFDEGRPTRILGPGAGYYMWTAALVVGCAAAFVGYARQRMPAPRTDLRPLSERCREPGGSA